MEPVEAGRGLITHPDRRQELGGQTGIEERQLPPAVDQCEQLCSAHSDVLGGRSIQSGTPVREEQLVSARKTRQVEGPSSKAPWVLPHSWLGEEDRCRTTQAQLCEHALGLRGSLHPWAQPHPRSKNPKPRPGQSRAHPAASLALEGHTDDAQHDPSVPPTALASEAVDPLRPLGKQGLGWWGELPADSAPMALRTEQSPRSCTVQRLSRRSGIDSEELKRTEQRLGPHRPISWQNELTEDREQQ